ncbi:hypothetical protein GOV09_02395 [Candidatus Woesearchaeota archaeon]|nr:hypothetical protein [Candidatus Woesearchaeota archaeon]
MSVYDLEESKIIEKIISGNYKKVLLQLPDGLKTEVEHLVPKLEKETNASILVWYGTNFGACDLPISVQALGVDLVIAFGHNKYVKDVKGW